MIKMRLTFEPNFEHESTIAVITLNDGDGVLNIRSESVVFLQVLSGGDILK